MIRSPVASQAQIETMLSVGVRGCVSKIWCDVWVYRHLKPKPAVQTWLQETEVADCWEASCCQGYVCLLRPRQPSCPALSQIHLAPRLPMRSSRRRT